MANLAQAQRIKLAFIIWNVDLGGAGGRRFHGVSAEIFYGLPPPTPPPNRPTFIFSPHP